MYFIGAAEPMTLAGLREASNFIGCDAAALLAVIDVETEGCGFLPNRAPQILFERHVFRRETRGAFDKVAPHLSNPKPGGYGLAGIGQYDRLTEAITLDEMGALHATSWGLGQIMGFNAMAAGYPDVKAMISAFVDREDAHLMAIAEFCRSQGLDRHLSAHDWASFAEGYNGEDFELHHYDERLHSSYIRHVNGHPIDMDLRAAQVRLRFARLYHARVDGIDGPATRAALAAAMIRGIDVGYPTV